MTAVEWKTSVYPEHDAGLMWAIAASAVVHAAVVAALVLFPQRFGVGKPGVMSYTVELVGASAIGGTNVVAGRKGKPQPIAVARSVPVSSERAAAPAVPPPDVSRPEIVPEPPPPAAQPAPPAPQPAPPAPQPAPELAGPPPPEPAQPEAAVAVQPEVVIPGPKPPPAKPVPPAEPLPIAKPPEAAKQLPPKPEAKAKPEPAKKPAARAQEKAPATPVQAVARAAPAPASQPKSAATPAVPAPTAKIGREVHARDEQIAAAVKRRKDEQRIADAVAQRAQAVRRRGNETTSRIASAKGAPISSGGGVGSGGVLEAMEVVLYLSEIEKRTRANWVWAGADQSLEAKVQFEITDEGQVRNVRTVSSSGDQLYDASAERAVWAASPLPPPPVKYRERFVDGVELTFRPQDLDS